MRSARRSRSSMACRRRRSSCRPFVRFGSWVGGDMDGNPDVNAKSMRETLARQQQVILNAYFDECQSLVQQLSQSASRISVSRALASRIDDYMTLLPSARTNVSARHDRMPYRVFPRADRRAAAPHLRRAGERLRAAAAVSRRRAADRRQPARQQGCARRDSSSCGGCLRRIDTFGFHIATLDVRQHTSLHHQMLARGLDDPHWSARPRSERRAAPRRRARGRRRPARRARCARQAQPVGI